MICGTTLINKKIYIKPAAKRTMTDSPPLIFVTSPYNYRACVSIVFIYFLENYMDR